MLIDGITFTAIFLLLVMHKKPMLSGVSTRNTNANIGYFLTQQVCVAMWVLISSLRQTHRTKTLDPLWPTTQMHMPPPSATRPNEGRLDQTLPYW